MIVLFRACVSRGAKGAMAPPLFEVLLVKTCSNYHSKIRPLSNGTPGFENLMVAMNYDTYLAGIKPRSIEFHEFNNE